MDDSYHLFEGCFGRTLERLPSEYVWSHFFFGIVRDPLVVPMLGLLHADRLIWGSDFPHCVGSWPNSRRFVEDAFAGVDPAVRDRIVRENAMEFFGLDL
jgi:predicted TIM-barrel fold metal-dependent hydrolase